jgi:hypothetical protein
MPRAKVRGGRKQHNKRVALRNEKIKSDWKRASKSGWEKFEEMKKQKDTDVG